MTSSQSKYRKVKNHIPGLNRSTFVSKRNLHEDSKFTLFLENALKAVRTSENPDELNKFRKLFKKAVPLTMRSYVAAYLTKTAIEDGGFAKSYRNYMKEKNSSSVERTLIRPSRPKIIIPEDKASSLFISLGKKRGIFPKDIISFIMQNTGISRERIGEIRILANYSFVQVFTEDAEFIINSLKKASYRGKPVAVSYSKKQDTAEYTEERNESNENIEQECGSDLITDEVKAVIS